jgi:hypothetical protein
MFHQLQNFNSKKFGLAGASIFALLQTGAPAEYIAGGIVAIAVTFFGFQSWADRVLKVAKGAIAGAEDVKEDEVTK